MYYLCDRARLAEACEWLSHPEISGIELQGFANPLKSAAYVDAIRQHRNLIKFENCYAHGPYAGLSAGHPDPLIRDVARMRIEEFVASAIPFGLRRFVLHMNYCPQTDKPLNWCKRFVAFWRDFLAGQRIDTSFFLENTQEIDSAVFQDAVGGIDDHRIRLCVDLGHLYCNGCDAVRWLEILRPWIGYFHVHDNHGLTKAPFYERDEHLALSAGTFPWPLFGEVYARLFSGIPLGIETRCRDWGTDVSFLNRLLLHRVEDQP